MQRYMVNFTHKAVNGNRIYWPVVAVWEFPAESQTKAQEITNSICKEKGIKQRSDVVTRDKYTRDIGC